jgi:hypothetical protein
MSQRGRQFPGLDVNGPTGKLICKDTIPQVVHTITVWSMPGGFTSGGRDGYQTVEEDTPRAPSNVTSVPPSQPVNQSGNYQSV